MESNAKAPKGCYYDGGSDDSLYGGSLRFNRAGFATSWGDKDKARSVCKLSSELESSLVCDSWIKRFLHAESLQ